MSDKPLFQGADEQEAIYAPQQVPAEQARVKADGGGDVPDSANEPPAAAPVANMGNAPSAAAAPPDGQRNADDIP